MVTPAFVQVAPDSTGKQIDNCALTVATEDVLRQVTVVGDPEDPDARNKITNAPAGDVDYGLVTRNLPQGTQGTKELRGSVASSANVAGSVTSVTLLALNVNRLGASIYNDSTATLYVKYGAAASLTSFMAKVFADGFLVLPMGYTGVVDGIWDAAVGTARVTEVTP